MKSLEIRQICFATQDGKHPDIAQSLHSLGYLQTTKVTNTYTHTYHKHTYTHTYTHIHHAHNTDIQTGHHNKYPHPHHCTTRSHFYTHILHEFTSPLTLTFSHTTHIRTHHYLWEPTPSHTLHHTLPHTTPHYTTHYTTHMQGLYAKAEEYYQQSLQIMEHLYGPNHPESAQSMEKHTAYTTVYTHYIHST